MSENTLTTGHGIYITANFEVEKKTTVEQKREAEYRTYILSIICGGADRANKLSYEIRATGYSTPTFMLNPQSIYFLRGAFFPSNTLTTEKDQLFFEASERGLVCTNVDDSSHLVNTVSVTSLGRVSKIEHLVEDCMQYLRTKSSPQEKITMVVTVEHSDYHPETKLPKISRVEYRIRPFRHLSGSNRVVKVGRECHFHGFIKDFNEQTMCYVVIVNRVSTTSGHRDNMETNHVSAIEDSSSQSTSSKPKKFKPGLVSAQFKSPVIGSDAKSSMPFGPSDFTEANFSSASSKSRASNSANKVDDGETVDESPPPPKKNKTKAAPKATKPPATAPAKRARARPARRGAAEKIVDITSDE